MAKLTSDSSSVWIGSNWTEPTEVTNKSLHLVSNESEVVLNCSDYGIFNVTESAPIAYASVMYGAMMPFLLLLTLTTNLLIIAVLTKRHMRSSTNSVLLWLAIADLLTLVFPAPWYFYMYTLHYHQFLLHLPFLCYLYHVMIEHIPMFFHTTSIWLTILLAGQRYIFICHPTMAKTMCTIRKVNRAIRTIFIASLLVQTSRFFDTVYESSFCSNHMKELMPACYAKDASWVVRPDIYFPLYFGFRIVFVNLGPCIALVILNVLLFCALQRAQATRRKLLKEKNETSRKKRNDLSNSTTYMLIVVVSVFLLVEIPMAFATLVHLLVNTGMIHFEDDSHLPYTKLTILLCNFIIMLSFPLNFAIYCGMSAQFRNTFKALFVNCSVVLGARVSESVAPVAPDGHTVSLAIVGDGVSTAPIRPMSTSAPNKVTKHKHNNGVL